MTNIWDADRLAKIGYIMDQYSPHLQNGDTIRLGHEGDPCSIYRSAEDAPSGKVEGIQREDDGTIRFRAVLENGTSVDLDNRNIASDRIWEVHPEFSHEFSQRVFKGNDNDPQKGLDEKIREIEFRGTDMEQTIAESIRQLAGDMMRLYRGESPVFSEKFADRYDMAMHAQSDYKGTSSPRSREDNRHDNIPLPDVVSDT